MRVAVLNSWVCWWASSCTVHVTHGEASECAPAFWLGVDPERQAIRERAAVAIEGSPDARWYASRVRCFTDAYEGCSHTWRECEHAEELLLVQQSRVLLL